MNMNKIRVVLIEDHDLTRVGLRATLQQTGTVNIVGEAANGVQGLKLLQETKPDVAMVDIGLPLMDGIELTRNFQQNLSAVEGAEPSSTKFLMLTMHDSEESVLAAFAAGADSYCMKDSKAATLLEALQSTYEGNNWIDPAIAQIIVQHNRSFSQVQANKMGGKARTVVIAGLSTEDSQLLQSYPLTERENDVLSLIVEGCSNAQIAERLYITVGTVKTHVRNILNKMAVDDRTQIAVRALRAGLVE